MSDFRSTRRDFLMTSAGALGAAGLLGAAGPAWGRQDAKQPAQQVLPRWRGFNLTYFFTLRDEAQAAEDDFRWLQDWGFNFIRLPMTYQFWVDPNDWYQVKEEMLARIDRVVDLGQKYGQHVSLNFHRGPGYCVNPPAEKLNLWKDAEAEKAFCWHWNLFAKRYKSIDSRHLSFDLINEPANPSERMSREDYVRVMRAATTAIREVDPQRTVLIDGLRWGRETVPELVDLKVGQSTRGYDPMASDFRIRSGLTRTRKRTSGRASNWRNCINRGLTWPAKELASIAVNAVVTTRRRMLSSSPGSVTCWRF